MFFYTPYIHIITQSPQAQIGESEKAFRFIFWLVLLHVKWLQIYAVFASTRNNWKIHFFRFEAKWETLTFSPVSTERNTNTIRIRSEHPTRTWVIGFREPLSSRFARITSSVHRRLRSQAVWMKLLFIQNQGIETNRYSCKKHEKNSDNYRHFLILYKLSVSRKNFSIKVSKFHNLIFLLWQNNAIYSILMLKKAQIKSIKSNECLMHNSNK